MFNKRSGTLGNSATPSGGAILSMMLYKNLVEKYKHKEVLYIMFKNISTRKVTNGKKKYSNIKPWRIPQHQPALQYCQCEMIYIKE